MIIKRGYRKYKPWFEHRKDCYCPVCFKHKCTGNRKQRKINLDKVENVRENYFEYINSTLWAERKASYYRRYQRKCRACGALNNVDLHHMKYGEFGKEPDYYLIPFCRNCHDEYHKIYAGRNSIANAKLYAQTKQNSIRELIATLKTT